MPLSSDEFVHVEYGNGFKISTEILQLIDYRGYAAGVLMKVFEENARSLQGFAKHQHAKDSRVLLLINSI